MGDEVEYRWMDEMEADWSRKSKDLSIKVHKCQIDPLSLNVILLNEATIFKLVTKTHSRGIGLATLVLKACLLERSSDFVFPEKG